MQKIFLLCFVLLILLVKIKANFVHLPIVKSFANACKILPNAEKKECNQGEVLAWEVFSGFTNQGSRLSSDSHTILDCRRYCYEQPKCALVTFEHGRMCFQSESLVRQPKYNSEMSILSCCKIENPPYQEQLIMNAPANGKIIDKCKSVQNRKDACENAKWMKYTGYVSVRDEITAYRQVNEQDCMKKCNENIYCIVFAYHQHGNVCTLRHNLTGLDRMESFTTYVLFCCQKNLPLPVVTFARNNCIRVSSRSKADDCALPRVLSWQIDFDQTMSGSASKLKIANDVLCRKACNNEANCIAVSKALNSDDCNLFTSVAVKNQSQIELSSLSCCEKYLPLYKPINMIASENENECPIIKSRQESCENVVWIKYADFTVDGGDIAIHEDVDASVCMELCNEDSSCLLFVMTTENYSVKCFLKYRQISNNKASSTSSVYKISCCGNWPSQDLPLVLKTKTSSCKPFTDGKSSCGSNKQRAWLIFPGKKVDSDFKEMDSYFTEVACRKACLDHRNCLGVTSYFNGRCYFYDETSEMLNEPKADSLVLGCCSLPRIEAIHGHNVHPSMVHKDCQPVVDRFESCNEPIWEVHNNSDSMGAEIAYFSNLSLSQCKQMCSINSSCVIFTYNDEGGCLLKYRLTSLTWTPKYLTYILKCCAKDTKTIWVNNINCTQPCSIQVVNKENIYKITTDSLPQPHAIKFDGCQDYLFNNFAKVNLKVSKKDLDSKGLCNISLLVEHKSYTKEIWIQFSS